MARMGRVEFEGALYHVICRGDRREAIFQDGRDRETFLQTPGEVSTCTGWRVHAYVLVKNHYHLLVDTPQANLVRGMPMTPFLRDAAAARLVFVRQR